MKVWHAFSEGAAHVIDLQAHSRDHDIELQFDDDGIPFDASLARRAVRPARSPMRRRAAPVRRCPAARRAVQRREFAPRCLPRPRCRGHAQRFAAPPTRRAIRVATGGSAAPAPALVSHRRPATARRARVRGRAGSGRRSGAASRRCAWPAPRSRRSNGCRRAGARPRRAGSAPHRSRVALPASPMRSMRCPVSAAGRRARWRCRGRVRAPGLCGRRGRPRCPPGALAALGQQRPQPAALTDFGGLREEPLQAAGGLVVADSQRHGFESAGLHMKGLPGTCHRVEGRP